MNEIVTVSESRTVTAHGIFNINIERLEKKFNVYNFLDSIQRVGIWLKNEKGSEEKKYESQREYENEISELCYFVRYLGNYLARQKEKSHIINQKKWENVLSRWSIFCSCKIPQERNVEFLTIIE